MKVSIVLAKLKEDWKVIRPGQPDIGIRPVLETILVPVSLMWLNEGTEADVKKAMEYASKEGYRVFTYPVGESDPLGRAKRDVLQMGLTLPNRLG